MMYHFIPRIELRTVILILLGIYVSSYFIWSRTAMQIAKQYGGDGYYFVLRNPEFAPEWAELLVQTIYFPCIQVDRSMSGPVPSYLPLKDIN